MGFVNWKKPKWTMKKLKWTMFWLFSRSANGGSHFYTD